MELGGDQGDHALLEAVWVGKDAEEGLDDVCVRGGWGGEKKVKKGLQEVGGGKVA